MTKQWNLCVGSMPIVGRLWRNSWRISETRSDNADMKLSEKNRKDLEAKLGTQSDEGVITLIHGVLSADMAFDSMPKDEIKEETLFGVVRQSLRVQGLSGAYGEDRARHSGDETETVREAQVGLEHR